MFLRRLELYGFKSFGKRTKLEFGPGITAIVGPNGSGKSNIVDAIRWVLGEQRLKALRSDKVENLIFAGSDKRRSLGYAEVVLVLDNSSGVLPLEFTEIAVARRIYRSGESEFRLNNTPCRLKDIQELFVDTGLGRDTYALISQGQVENLLTMRPEERRLLLEEAAGILKYRYRKREVLRKLEEAEQNLVRVKDLLRELEKQLPVLEEEARREKLYRQYREELEKSQIALALHQLDRLLERRQTQLKRLEEERSKERNLEESVQGLAAEIEGLKMTLAKLEEELANQQEALTTVQARRGRLEESIVYQEERLTLLKNEIRKKEEQLAAHTQRLTVLKEREEGVRIQLHQFQQELAKSQENLSQVEERLTQLSQDLEDRQREVEAYRDEALEIMRCCADVKNELQLLKSRREAIEKSREELRRQLQVAQRESVEIKAQRSKLGENRQYWKENLVQNQKVLVELENKLSQTQVEMKRLRTILRQKQRELDRVRSRWQFIQELERNYEGYHRGVRTILQGFIQGVCGTVADLLQVDQELEQAIAVALGSSLQFVVVESDTVAQAAIEFLQQAKGGRATFLPLNTIRGEGLPNQGEGLLSLPGVLGRAADLIRSQKRYRPVVEFLLGRVLVVKDLTTARNVARRGGFCIKVVTLGGEVIAPGGVITGGIPVRNQVELLSRKREGKELARRQEVLAREVATLEEKLEVAQQELEDVYSKVQYTRTEIRQAELRLEELQREEQRLSREAEKCREVLATIRWEEEEARRAVKELDTQIQAKVVELTRLQQEGEKLQQRLGEAEERLLERKEEKKRQYEEVTAFRVRIAGLTQQVKVQQEQMEQFTRQSLELEEQICQGEEELVRLRMEEVELAEKLEGDRASLAQLKKEEAELASRVHKLRYQREGQKVELAQLEQRLKNTREELAASGERVHRLERELTRLETSMDEVKRRLFEDFSITPARAAEYHRERLSEVHLRQRILELKQELEQLSNVNLRAGEQYLEVRERYDFLSRQRQDVMEAQESLKKLLHDIDSISRQRLEATFTEVQASFAKIFQELFGGGRAELRFTGENPLEAGLDIIVQPPGKKLQNLLLLSGGEKALAAIAFLFSLLQVKPSPFCVLDEIDASLDDVNAQRLGEFLRRYATHTQFLVVSHRQETVSYADALYGVTLDESGVSQFISLKFGDTIAG